jgi:bisphosphoglycerate-dependent phosphoglycerate mutase
MKTSIPNSLRLYLIRHDETEWSLYGRHTARTDISLTQNGKDEVQELGKRLRDIPFANVLTSPLKRTLQTCELDGNIPHFSHGQVGVVMAAREDRSASR